jgi:ADP-L-glycero-D-manno-heptose 6-epimerase
MIVVTGAAGFIGSCMVKRLNEAGYTDVLAVDDFSRPDKNKNLEGKKLAGQVHRLNFVRWLERNHADVSAVIHLGARTDTTETSVAIFDELNLEYSKALWMLCAGFDIPFLYASSAATYGLGELGYTDDHALMPALKPLNPYGQSKQDFDVWLLQNEAVASSTPWAGFKFFNVYGPNEYHKGRMASVIMHTARKIKATGAMQLFRSHRPDYRDGEQSRDFIYVKDVVDVLLYFLENKTPNGIYNLGTGKARTFLDLAKGTFQALQLAPDISFIDTPADIRDTYQYFTEADMHKVRQAGYHQPFYGLEAGIEDYVQRYLAKDELVW